MIKLSEQQRSEIIRRVPTETTVSLAREFGVTASYVSLLACTAGISIGRGGRRAGKGMCGPLSYRWKGGKPKGRRGYVYVLDPQKKRHVLQHILIVERVLGKPLPAGAVVHHANGDPRDNRNENLVVCPSRAYHALIHRRMRAKEACGNAGWLKCRHCKCYDHPDNMHVYRSAASHRACAHAYQRQMVSNPTLAGD